MRTVKYSTITKETYTHSGTFALGDFSPKLSEKSENIRPLNVPGDRMGKDRFQSFKIFSLHMLLVPQCGTTVKVEYIARNYHYEATKGRGKVNALSSSQVSYGCPRNPRNYPTEVIAVCRNIRTLYNFDPPATVAEVHAAALQYVRKISGFASPSAANEAAFQRAVAEIEAASARLLGSLVTAAPPKNRATEAASAHARGERRFGPGGSR